MIKDLIKIVDMYLDEEQKHYEENPKKDHKDLQAYTKELMNYVFDDIMLDDLNPNNKKTQGKLANAIVTKRLKELGVKLR